MRIFIINKTLFIFLFLYYSEKYYKCYAVLNSGNTEADGQGNQSNKIVLDIANKKSTPEVDYSFNPNTHSERFKSKDQFKFEKVLDGSNLLWNSTDNKLVTELEVDYSLVDSSKQILYCLKWDQGTLILVKEVPPLSQQTSTKDLSSTSSEFSQNLTVNSRSRGSNEDSYSVTSGDPGALTFDSQNGPLLSSNKSVNIDINSKDSTDEYEYSRNPTTNFHTYKPKPGYIFKSVVKDDQIIQFDDSQLCQKIEVNEGTTGKTELNFKFKDTSFSWTLNDKPTTDSSDTTGERSEPATTVPTVEVEQPEEPEASTPSIKLVVVDLNIKESNDDFDYSYDSVRHTYTAKTGVQFNKVVKDSEILWESSGSRYLVKLDADFTDLGKVMLSIYYDSSGTHELHVGKDPHPDPLTMPSDASRVSIDLKSALLSDHLNVLTLKDDVSSTGDKSTFDSERVTHLFNYKFKEGSKCTLIKYNNITVWKHDETEHGLNYPNSLLLNTQNNFLFLQSTGSYQYSYSFYNNKWNQVSGYKAKAPKKLDVNKLELGTKKRDGTFTKFDSSRYKRSDSAGSSTFVFNKGVKCTMVRYDGHKLWEHSEEEFGTDFPTAVTLHPDKSYVMVDSGKKYRYMYTYYDEWKQEVGYKSTLSKPLDFDKLKVFTLEDDETTKENDKSKYTRTDAGVHSDYQFKPGTKCTEVKYEDGTVWKYNVDEHSDDYPVSLTLNKARSTLLVDSAPNYRYLLGFYNNEWVNLPFGYTSKKVMAPIIVRFIATPDKLTVVTLEDDGSTKENDETKYKKDDTIDLFTLKLNEGTMCTELKYDGVSVWKYDQNEHGGSYPKYLAMNKNNNLLMVNSDDYQFYYSYYNETWNSVLSRSKKRPQVSSDLEAPTPTTTSEGSEPATTVPTVEVEQPEEPEASTPSIKLVVVDLNIKESNDDFDYSYDSVRHTYTAKTGVQFNKVVKDSEILWESSGSRYLVKLDADFTDLGKVMLSIYYDSSGTHELHVGKDPHPDPLTMPSDASRVSIDPKSELLSDHLQLITLKDDGSYFEDKCRFDFERVTHLFNYKFKEGSKCTLIKYNNITVWNHDETEHGLNYPNSLLLNTQNNFLYVESTGSYQYSYSFYNNKWIQVLCRNVNSQSPKKLDVNKLELGATNREGTFTKFDSSRYKRSDSSGFSVFVFNWNVKCTIVSYDGHKLWEHSKKEFGNDFPTEVTLHVDKSYVMVGSGKKYRYMYTYYDEWKQELGYKSTLTIPLDFDKLTVVTLENDGTARDNDTSKYARKDTRDQSNFKLEPGTKCTEVKYEDGTVWQYNVAEHSDDYPVSLTLNKARSTLLVDSAPNYRYLLGYYNNEWGRLHLGYTSKKVKAPTTVEFIATPDKLTVVTLEDDGSTKQNDKSKYDRTDAGAHSYYKFKDETMCTELKYDGVSVWKYDQNEHGGSYPKSLALNKNNNLLMVNSDDYQFYYSYYNRTWNPLLSYKSKTKSQFSSVLEASTFSSKLVVVDLNIKESTDDFDYSYDSVRHTYTAKTGVQFNKVVKDTEILWESSDLRYLVKLDADFTDLGKVMLSIYYDSSGTHELHVGKDSLPDPLTMPSDASRVSIDPESALLSDHLNVLTLNDDRSFAGDKSTFDSERVTHLFNYKFKEGSKCTLIKYNNITVWNHDETEHGLNYPNSLLLNTPNNFLYVESTGSYQYSYSFYNNQWNQVSGYKAEAPENLDVNKLELGTTNRDGTTTKIDSSRYKRSDSSGFSVFVFNKGVKCTIVRYDGHKLWEHSEEEFGTDFPTAVTLHSDKRDVMVDSVKKYRYMYTYYDEWKLNLGYKFTLTKPLDFDKLKVFTLEDDETTKENDTSKYARTDAGDQSNYRFKLGSKCTEVKYEGGTVWQYNVAEHSDDYPVSLTLNKARSTLLVDSAPNYRYLLGYYKNEWVNLHLGYTSKKVKASATGQFIATPDKLTVVTLEDDGSTKENDETKYKKKDTIDLFTLKLNEGTKCTELKYDGVSVWKYDQNEHGGSYPKSLSLNKNNSLIMVNSVDYQFYYSYYNETWNSVLSRSKKRPQFSSDLEAPTPTTTSEGSEPATTVPTVEVEQPEEPEASTPSIKLVVVDLNIKESNDDFDYSYDSVRHTYTAKTEVQFNKVVKSGEILWESSDLRYLDKLDADYTDLGKVMLSIYYDSSGTHELHVGKDPHPDPLTMPSDASRVSIDPESALLFLHLQLITLNDDVSSTGDKSIIDSERVSHLFNYKFKEGSKCTLIKYNNITVWKHDETEHGLNYPNSLLLNTPNNFLYVESTGFYQYSYSFYNNQWNKILGRNANAKAPEKLDVNKLELGTTNRDGTTTKIDISRYKRSDSSGFSVFVFNKGVKCTMVRYDGHKLWEHSEEEFGTDFPTTVTLHPDKSYVVVDSPNKYRYMYTFYKKWKQELGYKFTLTKPLDFDKLKVFTLENDGTTKENDKSKYDRKDAGDQSNYRFKLGSKCTEVKYEGGTVWQYNVAEHSNDYPVSLTLNKARSTLLVDSAPNYRYLLGYYKNEWVNLPFGYTSKKVKGRTTGQFRATPDKLTVVTLEDDGSTKENNETKYKKEDTIDLFTLKLNEGTMCTELKYDGVSVWKYDQNEHGGSYPKSLALNKNNSLIMVNSDDYQFYYSYYNETWNSVLSRSKKRPQVSSDLEAPTPTTTSEGSEPATTVPTVEVEQPEEPESSTPSIKLVVVDLNTKNETHDFYYSFDSDSNLHTYTAKTGVQFIKVVKDSEILWESSGSRYLLKLDADFSQLGSVVLSLYYDSSGSYELYFATDPNPDPLSTPLESSTVSIDPKSELLSLHLKALTLDDGGSSTQVSRSKFSVQSLTDLLCYTFREGAKCTELKYNNVSVWKHDSNKHGLNYPTLSLLNSTKNFLYVESIGSYQYSYSFYNNKWNQVSGYKAKEEALEKLDPNKLELETTNRDGKTAKNDSSSYEIKDVSGSSVFVFKKGVKCTKVSYDGHKLWEHSEKEFGTDFPTTVTLHPDKSYVMVDSGNKYRYMYTYYKKWKQELGYKSTLSKPLDFDKITVVTLEDDGTTKENDTSKYDRKDSALHSEYKFMAGTKCTEVKYEDGTVWKYNVDEHSNDYPVSLTLNKARSTLLVDSAPNYRYLLGYYNNIWVRLPFGYTSKKVKGQTTVEITATPDKLTVVTLEDDGSTKQNDETKYKKEDVNALFRIKFNDETMCTEVKYDGVSVWKYDQNEHSNEYPSTVTLNKITKLVMIDSPSYQFYYSYYNDQWNTISSYKSDSSEETAKEEALKSLDSEFYTKTQLEELIRLAKLPLGDIKYSKVKENNPKKDESDIYVADRDSTLVPKSIYEVPERIQSALDVLAESAKFFKDKPHLGKRKKTVRPDGSFELGDFEFLTYEESYKVAKAIGTALTQKSLVPETTIDNCQILKKGRFLGIWAPNCPYWLLTDYACTGYGFVTVPIYEILGDDALLNILKNTKMETVCIDSKKVPQLEKLKSQSHIKTVIVFDSLTDDDKNKLSKLGITFHLMDDLVKEYKDNPQNPPNTKRTDICTIIYTSGTSGDPKGAVYTNEHFVIITERYANIQNRANMRFESSMLSFLPLSHIYQRSIEHLFPPIGGKIGYYSGDVKNILDDFQKFQPTFFLGDPRAYTKILAKIREELDTSELTKPVFIRSLNEKKKKFKERPHKHKDWFHDWILGKTSDKVGGKLEVMISGSAAMTSDDVCDIQSYLLAPMAEGWGTTELGVSILQDFRDPTKGTIGGPLYGVEFKLRSVPQLGYDARGNPPRGELLVKSPGMMLGYTKDTLTKENLEDGWFKSGDVVELLPNMGLKIIDRIQNIIKLSQGDYIASEKLENAYITSQFVDQLYVHVDSSKDHIVGIVVLSKENVEKWANKNGLKGSQMKDLLQNESLKKAIQEDFNKIADSQKFNSLEKLRVFKLVDDPFSVDNGMLTPTFKNVRHKIREKYKDIIQRMYTNSQPT